MNPSPTQPHTPECNLVPNGRGACPLHAAAPSMYDTIAWLLSEVEEQGQGNLPDGLLSQARKIVAKAEGR